MEPLLVYLHVYIILTCREGLGEGYDGDIAFASALETFGGGHNDPISVAFGGLSHFVTLYYHLRELHLGI